MTSNEFVAFLKGLSVGISESPTKEQWDIILKNLKLVKKFFFRREKSFNRNKN